MKCVGKWYYICLLLNSYIRKIICSAISRSKNAKLVKTAFYSVQVNLRKIEIFHTDRGDKFNNKIVDEIISAFVIKRFLSAKGIQLTMRLQN